MVMLISRMIMKINKYLLPSDTTISRMHEEASLDLAVPHLPLELVGMMLLEGVEAEVEAFSEARATRSVEMTTCVHFTFS